MSYYCFVSFKKCESFEKALFLSHKFCNSIKKDNSLIKDIIKNNITGIPSNWRSCERKAFDLNECFSWWDRDWLNSLFKFRFIFWKKQKLLAIYNGGLLKTHPFFPLSITFQNYTDNDYDYKKWTKGKIPYFNNLVNLFKSYNNKKIIDIYKKRWKDEPCDSDIDYFRREMLYTHISDDLQMEKLIFGKKGKFIEFSMSPITCSEINYEYYKILKNHIEN